MKRGMGSVREERRTKTKDRSSWRLLVENVERAKRGRGRRRKKTNGTLRP